MNKTSWDENATTIGDNIVDGGVLKAKREDVLKELEDTDMLAASQDKEVQKRIDTAIEGAYGTRAQLVEDTENGGYKIINAKGETQRTGITSDDLKNIVAT